MEDDDVRVAEVKEVVAAGTGRSEAEVEEEGNGRVTVVEVKVDGRAAVVEIDGIAAEVIAKFSA